jgi:hypothetical protein
LNRSFHIRKNRAKAENKKILPYETTKHPKI